MKYLSDLKIGDKVWEVNKLDIREGTVIGLTIKNVNTTLGNYGSSADAFYNSNRAVDKFNTNLCITYKDAIDLCIVNCFDLIKEHMKTIKEKAEAIEAINLRINELNYLRANNE